VFCLNWVWQFAFCCAREYLIVFQTINTPDKIVHGVVPERSEKSPRTDKMERDFMQSPDTYGTSSQPRHMFLDQDFVVFRDLPAF
jgi:hypothetical protein